MLSCLAGVAQLVGRCPVKQKVPVLIPSQSMCLGCGFGAWSGAVWNATSRCFSLTPTFPSFSPSFPLSLKEKRKEKNAFFKEQVMKNYKHIQE